MRRHRILQIALGGATLIAASALAATGGAGQTTTPLTLGPEFEGHLPIALPGSDARVAGYARAGRIHRIYGPAFSHGATPGESAQVFIDANISLVDADAADLVPYAMADDGSNTQPIGYLPEEDRFKFTGVYFEQQRDGVPVFGSRAIFLVRNEPGFPLVLANPDVRPLGDFRVDPRDAAAPLRADHAEQIMDLARQMSPLVGEVEIHATRRVIWAGMGDDIVAPRLADETDVHVGDDEWRLITDARTGAVLMEEHRICFADINGTVEGMASDGPGAEQCEPEVATPMPYIEVTAGGTTVFTNANGQYNIFGVPTGPVTVSSTLDGRWFDIFNFAGSTDSTSTGGNAPGQINLLYNAANNNVLVRSQTNAYVEANRVRDYIVAANPVYPTIQNENFTNNVNRTDGFCPGNAWYSPGEVSINFCQAGSSNPNTAWSSVVHHEFGHHVVEAGGSGQGQYGEGMGDVMSTIILDTPDLGLGFFLDCGTSLRSADNDLQYPCDGAIHFCGQLISGCVWDTRQNMVFTEPVDYQSILMFLAANSVLVHSGSDITPAITVDWLTLDDDNGNILDGTPHYAEINGGFSQHNMAGPELALLDFSFPNGLPDFVAPSGGTTLRFEVSGLTGSPAAGTGRFFYDDGSGVTQIPTTPISANVYDATFPANPCGTTATYYFSADTTSGSTQFWPPSAPQDRFSTIHAVDLVIAVDHDFETDPGYTVVNESLDDGPWGRGVPVGGGDREDPPTDFDGSGQCWLTDNVDGNSDVDGGPTRLTTNTLDLSGLSDPEISYARWFENDDNDTDRLVVEISSNGGATWTQVESVGDGAGTWVQVSFRVADFVTPTANVVLRFSADDQPNDSVTEAGLDALRVTDLICTGGPDPCPADIDGSGGVDFNDLVTMLSSWGPCVDCPADVNGDDVVDFTDLVTLLSAWGPCP